MSENADAKKEIQWVTSLDGMTEVYANFVSLNWTLYDVRLRLGQVVPNRNATTDSAFWQINEDTGVTIPWGQAKVLRDMLADAIQRYENVNGEITVPTLPQ